MRFSLPPVNGPKKIKENSRIIWAKIRFSPLYFPAMLRIGRVYGPGFSLLHFPAVADWRPAADVQNNLRT
jgi:hypothetical protein